MRTARWSRFSLLTCALLAGVALQSAACGKDAESGPQGQLAVDVQALTLSDVVAATWDLEVRNGLGETVWSRRVDSTRYGSGGSFAYVGPCDASEGAADNIVLVTLVELHDADGALTAVDFVNPAPAGDPLIQSFRCEPNADVAARFDVTIARNAQQGFFDVAVAFDDLFCSAKLDCESAPGVDLDLLHRPGGERDLTAVLGFACTGGPGADTHLWMDRVVVTCEGGGPFTVDVAAGPGNLDPVFDEPTADLFFQTATYRGSEALPGVDKAYWNIALGLNEDAFAALGDCRLSGRASASDGPLASGVTPDATRWPLIDWDVALVENGARVCTSHPLDGGTGVATHYTTSSGHGFYAGFERDSGLVTVNGAEPDGTSTLSCASSLLAVGEATTCTLVPRRTGTVIATASGNFQMSAATGALSALAPAYGTSFTFTFTATTSGAAPIATGVGVSWPMVVTDTPDATSTLTCADPVVDVSSGTTCTLVPKRAGVTIHARASAFTPAASGGTIGALAPAVGTSFTVAYGAPATTGPVSLTTSPGAASLTVVDTPDGSILSCAAATLPVGQTMGCTSVPTKGGVPIHARASAIAPSATAGSVSAASPAVGSAFTFDATAPATTGPVTIGDGLSTTSYVAYTTPDASSTLTCAASVVDVGGTTTCTITPRSAGVVVHALASAFSPSATAGSVSAAAPALGTSFTFTFTAPATTGLVTIGDGVSTTTLTVVDTPDTTSTLTCADGELDVGLDSACTLVPKKAGVTIHARASAFSPGATAGAVGSLSPAVGNAFALTYSAPTTTGPVTIDTHPGTFSLTVVDTPTTTTLTCAAASLLVGTPTTCTSIPKKGGVTIYTRASAIDPTTTAGSVSAATPAVGNAFTFTATAPTTTGVVQVGDGLSTTTYTAYAQPDPTSTVTCADSVVDTGGTTTCTIVPRRSGIVIHALASAFTPSATAGSVTSASPALGQSFTFTYTAPATTGPVTVDSGWSTTTLTVVATPDATLLVCDDSALPVGGTTTCTITPTRGGAAVHARATSFFPTTTAGSVGAVSPAVGTSFTFDATAPGTSGPVTVGDGYSTTTFDVYDAPDTTSSLSCPATVAVSQAAVCTITPRRASAAIHALASAFTPSASAGSVGAAGPALATSFTFTFTAPATSGPVTIGAGLGTSASITVVDSPDATSTLACGATIESNATATCTVTPRRAGVVVYALATDLAPAASAGSTGTLSPSVGTAFTFSYTAPLATGAVTVQAGPASTGLTVYGLPDGTSSVACSPGTVPGASTATCTITPRRGGVVIHALATAFSPSASAGTVSAVSPALASALTFTFTAPRTAQSVSIGVGPASTTVTVTATCGDGYENGPSETDVDCGGGCGPCANGLQCAIAADCQSGFCGGDFVCADGCPTDPLKTAPGLCGCGVSDTASLRLGGTASNPGRSCTDIADEGQACGDRRYWIDPTGGSIGDAFEVYCDMTDDGGAWMKIESAQYPFFFDSGNYLSLSRTDPSVTNYSIVGDRAKFVDADGCYELRVEMGNGGSWLDAPTKKTIWRQCHDPFTAATNGTDYTFIGGEAPTTCAGFNGLHNTYQSYSYATDVDSTDSASCWYMQVVPNQRYESTNGYLHGYGGPGVHQWQSLWIRAQGRGKGHEDPATSCDVLRQEGLSDDGVYFLDTSGGDNADAFPVYCDMTPTAGWTRLNAARYPFFFGAGNYLSYLAGSPTSANYSILDMRSVFASGGCWTFRIQLGESGTWQGAPSQEIAWRQCHDPFTTSTDGSDYTYVSGTPPLTCGGFNGLHYAAHTFMYTSDADATDLIACWGMQTVPHTQYPDNPGYYDGYGGDSSHQWQTLWVK